MSVTPGPPPPGRGQAPAREYHYAVDAEGRVFHDGTEIVDAPTLRFFVLAMQALPDGRHLVVCQGERNWFHAEGPPLVVQRLHFTRDGGIEAALAGDLREPLDLATLEHAGDHLFCRVRRGALRARLGRLAMQQLAPLLVETPDGPAVAWAGRRYAVAARP